ncbi:Uncharacterised protein [Chlamydia trachomatis]|nr:Uncharacterised protein [Chlamydia trachomatis]
MHLKHAHTLTISTYSCIASPKSGRLAIANIAAKVQTGINTAQTILIAVENAERIAKNAFFNEDIVDLLS